MFITTINNRLFPFPCSASLSHKVYIAVMIPDSNHEEVFFAIEEDYQNAAFNHVINSPEENLPTFDITSHNEVIHVGIILLC